MTDYELSILSDNHLKDYIEAHTKKSPKGSYICLNPLCKSGEGKNQTGAFFYYLNSDGRPKFKCQSCGIQGDLFDLIGIVENIPERREQIKRAQELYDPLYNSSSNGSTKSGPAKEVKPLPDYTEQYKEWNSHLNETDYHRGISLETLNRFNVGYCSSWKSPIAPKSVPTERLIIPTSSSSYIARYIKPCEKDERIKKAGEVKIFNGIALTTAKRPIFVVEGEIDALSIIDVGGEAIALGGAGNLQLLYSQLDSMKLLQPLIIALDNDKTGIAASERLVKGLDERKIKYSKKNLQELAGAPIDRPYDANDLLNWNREKFRKVIAQAAIEAAEEAEAKTREERETYRSTFSNAAFMDNFRYALTDKERRRFYPTGFSRLNELLDGGLHEGLTVIGALSSLGKTTFILQIADSMARRGLDVIYFTLEQSREELIAKSVSRLSYLLDERPKKEDAKTVRGLYKEDLSFSERELISKAIESYENEISRNMFVCDGVTSPLSVVDVRKTVEEHIALTGNSPVVFVDYLQILKADPKNTNPQDSKQNTDYIVSDLRKIARDYHIPVVCLSSFNRASYNKKADMAAFKESGGIEYSSDLLITLELSTVSASDKDTDIAVKLDRAKNDEVKDIRLNVLKNRSGRRGETEYSFDGRFNLFLEK